MITRSAITYRPSYHRNRMLWRAALRSRRARTLCIAFVLLGVAISLFFHFTTTPYAATALIHGVDLTPDIGPDENGMYPVY